MLNIILTFNLWNNTNSPWNNYCHDAITLRFNCIKQKYRLITLFAAYCTHNDSHYKKVSQTSHVVFCKMWNFFRVDIYEWFCASSSLANRIYLCTIGISYAGSPRKFFAYTDKTPPPFRITNQNNIQQRTGEDTSISCSLLVIDACNVCKGFLQLTQRTYISRLCVACIELLWNALCIDI